MDIHKRASIEKVSWQDVREAVHRCNPAFAEVVDQIDPPSHFALYRARYPFGSTIIKDGVFYVPAPDGSVVPISDRRIPTDIQKTLSYNHNTIPVGIVLHRSVELFLNPEGRIVSMALMAPGMIFALWSALDPPLSYHVGGVWQMVSGARSLSILPKITDFNSYKRLSRARAIKLPMSSNLFEHGLIMAQMAQHRDFPYVWYSELLFFSEDWLREYKESAWIQFRYFLHKEAWYSAAYWRNKHLFDFTWDSFVKELGKQNARVTPYIMDIVKHLIMVGLGVLPGFGPGLDDEVAPVEGLQADFYEVYNLKRFAATIMVPKHLSSRKLDIPVYWSFQFSTYLESTPKPKTISSTLSVIHEVYHVLSSFCSAALSERLKGVQGTPIYDLAKNVEFEFFHSDDDPDEIVKPSLILPKEDKSLIKSPYKYGRKGFSAVSPFVRGCVRIKAKSEMR